MSLSNAQQENLKKRLEQMKQQIEEDLRHHNPGKLDAGAGEGDSVTNDVISHDTMAQYLHQHEEWQALQRAQARLAENIADICQECGVLIPFARLEAEPTAERCIACQEKMEAEQQRLHIHTHNSM
ncbi:TraR/DksA family transcriptional regulator [Undibacterium oligocarboniphilum]|uniref:TraR/DksA family transcriptional regulator n=1 Tax=Undibacterium oligocarboniphilum TaxID=666702 RepID=A0A850QDW9_9BURK|nr:TraR/DksA family transcriptional regulator [Undibacterium oligocarboniphilum]MBC3869796.1 TraR/DksA family transcriptional regulator [Undibacterium oligocarboniphilum]NVO77399.1 TraR/DksA family transcriptional regulator [Undibacterium oligocarboniphilum]